MEPLVTPQSGPDNPYAAPAALARAPGKPQPPILKAWIAYALTFTVASWMISGILGQTIFRVIMSVGLAAYWIFPIITLALTLPVSYFLFRWAVRKYLLDTDRANPPA